MVSGYQYNNLSMMPGCLHRLIRNRIGYGSSLLLDIDRRSPWFRKSPLTLWIDIVPCRISIHDRNCAVKRLPDETGGFGEYIQFIHRIDTIPRGILFSITIGRFLTILMPA